MESFASFLVIHMSYLDKNATKEEVKKSYRKMVMKYHPDKLQGVSKDIVKLAEEKFRLVQQAYDNIIKIKFEISEILSPVRIWIRIRPPTNLSL